MGKGDDMIVMMMRIMMLPMAKLHNVREAQVQVQAQVCQVPCVNNQSGVTRTEDKLFLCQYHSHLQPPLSSLHNRI